MEAIVYFRLTYKYGPMNANLSECHVFIIGSWSYGQWSSYDPNYGLIDPNQGLISVQNECPMEQVGHFQARQTEAPTEVPGPTEAPGPTTESGPSPTELIIVTNGATSP